MYMLMTTKMTKCFWYYDLYNSNMFWYTLQLYNIHMKTLGTPLLRNAVLLSTFHIRIPLQYLV